MTSNEVKIERRQGGYWIMAPTTLSGGAFPNLDCAIAYLIGRLGAKYVRGSSADIADRIKHYLSVGQLHVETSEEGDVTRLTCTVNEQRRFVASRH